MVRETHSPNMDGPTSFRFPANDSQPLQQLSPERINSVTTVSTTTKHSVTNEYSPVPSPQSSPTRRAKANLFADYDPNRLSPTKSSLLLGGGGIPQSPSLPEITALRNHGRTNSDVQGLVKRFEHLDVRDKDAESAEKIRRREAELKRALMAREEAEADARKFRAELRQLQRLADEGAERERIVARRVEILMGELAASQEAHRSQSEVYEREVRKARKEAFKTSSALVKSQEELKNARSALRATQQDREQERQESLKKEQERFDIEYQLVPLQEELNKLERHLKVAQEETLALKAHLKEEEVARIAAEGRLPLPPSQDLTDEFASPRKQSPVKLAASPLSDDKENLRSAPKKAAENRRMLEELEREKMRREHAEELADFLQLECNFRCCGCKRASRLGHELSLSLDDALNEGMAKIREGMHSILTPPASVDERDAMDIEPQPTMPAESGIAEQGFEMQTNAAIAQQGTEEVEMGTALELDRSMTFGAESPRPASPSAQLMQEDAETAPAAQGSEELLDAAPMDAAISIPLQPSTPTQSSHHHDTTPFRQHPSIRTVTTTTTIPMHFTPVAKPHLQPSQNLEETENIPPPSSASTDPDAPTFDRAAALAAIEYRRGRAKSLANGTATPRKQMIEGVAGRRDISAPALGQKSANVGAGVRKMGVSGTASVGRSQGRGMR